MRLTKHRQEILSFLEKNHGAHSVATIHSALPHINLVTIYRGLDFLVGSNAVTKVNLGEDEAYFEVQTTPHHHAICTKCGEVIHFTLDDEALKNEFRLPRFSIKNLEITVYGTCSHHKDRS